jgi:hypothetical protein
MCAWAYQYIPQTTPGVTALPDWLIEEVPMPVKAPALTRDPGHGDCCDCTAGGLGGHCEGHMENASSLTPEPGCEF